VAEVEAEKNEPEQVALSDEFIREVDEEVRQERYEILWKRYGRYVLAAAVAIVLATAAGVLWKNYERQQREGDSRIFIEAVSKAGQENPDEALALLGELAEDGTTGYALLARLREAGILAQKGDSEAAVIVYNRIADDSSAPATYRDFARLMAVMHEVDTIDPDAAQAQLVSLLVDDNAWRFSARELVAVAALRVGQIDRARDLLESNADDPDAPQGIRARATQLLATLDS